MNTETCPRCGGTIRIDPDYTGPHFGRYVCSACGRHCGWARMPMTEARAAAFRMPFGRYKNSTLEEVGQIDKSYLKWLATECETEGIRRAAACHLASITGKIERSARA